MWKHKPFFIVIFLKEELKLESDYFIKLAVLEHL